MVAIEDHGIIGDLRTGALVASDGAIDFLCWPAFDSPSVFARLLDPEGGAFEIAPDLDEVRPRQLYLPDTNILLTRFLSPNGVAELSDFMSVCDPDGAQRLVRRVKAIRETVGFCMRCAPRFDYGRDETEAVQEDDTVIFRPKSAGSPALRLIASVPLEVKDGAAVARFELDHDRSATFVLQPVEAAAPDSVGAFKRTTNYWRDWVDGAAYSGRWREVVIRSALTLKLLTSAQHGSIIAALTFGLPEEIGGERNWDYRYAWIRDSAFTIYAFLRLNLVGEAINYQKWLRALDQICPDGRLELMASLDGSETPEEETLEAMEGYRGSGPVRIGNKAAGQLQLDIYGELLDALYLSDKHAVQISVGDWKFVLKIMGWLSRNWNSPDEGIWEMRNGRAHNLHSRVMCWVAFDRAIRLAHKRGLPAPTEEWRAARDEIWHDVHDNFWNEEMGAFVQTEGGTTLDASCLLMPLVRFIGATDPRWLSTLSAVRETLLDDSLVFRYSTDVTDDGLDGAEGTFNMCSFWYVECLARAGDVAQARFLFEKMLGYANPLGLFAEETGPAGEHLGNFPQAFTHLGLISAAFALDRALDASGPGTS